jgi:DNA invertase Pin-like site-specific DNA recombinase
MNFGRKSMEEKFKIYQVIFGYSRKSPDDKEETKRSILNQKELIEDTAKYFGGVNVKHFVDENITGSDRFRKGFTAMISEAIEIKETNPEKNVIIIVKHQERFARDSSFFRDTLKDHEARQIDVFSVMKNNYLSSKDLGDSVESLLAERTVLDGKEKAELTMKKKMEQGKPPIPAPFGYKYDDKTKDWIVIKKEASLINEVLQRYLDSIELRVILRDLEIDKGLYYRIVKNAKKGLYSGFIVFERKHRDSNKKVVRTEEVKYPGVHPKIIDEELYNKVNKKL